MKPIDLIGEKFGKLTIIGLCRINRNPYPIQGLVCICDCGKTCNVSYYSVKDGNTSSCGYNYRLQLEGKKFGLLTVVERVEQGVNKNLFRCICQCGNEKTIVASELKRGKHKSCGCNRALIRRVTYQYRDHPLYDVWKGMKSRCNSVTHMSYKNYGAKGVKVCPEWNNAFKPFYDWALSNGYKKGMQIDKDIIPGKWGSPALLYSPEMCCWVTPLENQR